MLNPEPNRKELLETFKKQLTVKQKELLEKATNPFFGIDLSKIYEHIKFITPDAKEQLSEEEIEEQNLKQKKEQAKAYFAFKKSLSITKRSYFIKEIEPFIDDRGSVNDPFDRFDTGLAQRWIFNRVIKLGYDPAIHGQFDKTVNSHISDRREHKSERIGKKYQWIAYHEFIALVSDHFEFKGNGWNESKEIYKGPWSPYVRDIDPTFILQNDDHLKESPTFSDWKNNHGQYDAWKKAKSNLAWIKTNSNLPNPADIIQISDDEQKKWLVLQGIFTWQQDTPPEYKKYDIPVREMFYILKSFIVKKDDHKKIINWIGKKGFGNWLPESSNFYEILIGEYPNSFAFDDLRGNYNIWTNPNKDLKIPVVVTDDSYLNEFTLDCSHSGSVSVKLPCKWLVNELNIKQDYLDGRFYDKKNKLVALTTSIFEENLPSALLMDKETLINFLDKKGYVIFWTLLGEKQLIGGNHSREDFIGRLEISGVYTNDKKGNIHGKITNRFKK